MELHKVHRSLDRARSDLAQIIRIRGGQALVESEVEDSRPMPLGRGMVTLEEFRREYAKSFLADWNNFIADYGARARSTIDQADGALEAISKEWIEREIGIRNKKSQREDEIRNKKRQSESEIRSKYENHSLPGKLTIRPLTLIETAKLESFQEHWWKFGLGALAAGWFLINLDFGVLAGIGGIAGQLWWLQKRQHEGVGEKQADIDQAHHKYQSDLVTATKLREELAAATRQDQDIATETATKLLQELSAEITEKTEAHRIAYAEAKKPLVAEWIERCNAFNAEMPRMQARFDSIITEVGARFAQFDDNDVVHEAIEDLDDQLSFRIGDRGMLQPNKLEKELALTLSLIERPMAFERRSPVFFELGARKTLLIDGATQPASAAQYRLFDVLLTRALRQIPPGKATFTLIDPLGLGSNFAHFLKLQDYSDSLINGMVWTNKEQIKKRLRDAIEHIERVTQKYLRADYPDIESYNREAGEIAEPYRLNCIADFPEGFDEEAVRDLVKIVQNGPRCGVHTLIYHNRNVKPAYGINLDELLPFCQVLTFDEASAKLVCSGGTAIKFALDPAPNPAQIKRLVDSFGAGAIDAMKVEVPFPMLFDLAKLKPGRWTENSTTGITVPLGPSGAKKALSITFDSKLSHNALVVGRPGSGKSNMIHVFISMVCENTGNKRGHPSPGEPGIKRGQSC